MSDELARAAGRPDWVRRLVGGVSRWERPYPGPQRLEPALATRELLEWSQDAGRWHPRAARDWRSLLDGVYASWSGLGPRLRAVVGVDAQLAAIDAIRQAQPLITSDHHSMLLTAAQALSTAFDASGALAAAADDVLVAARSNRYPESLDEETVWRLALLASVGEQRGHDWGVIADRFLHAFEGAIDEPLSASMRAVHHALEASAGRGHSIVWLAVDHASFWGPSPTPLVQLIDGDWLLAVLREWEGPRAGVPPEIAADPSRLLKACRRIDEEAAPTERLPVTFARVDLGEGPTAGARERAQDTLELLIARASTRQGGTNWKVHGTCLHFVDGQVVFESTGPIGDPDIYDRLTRGDILHDQTGTLVNEEAERLRTHLPVRDGRLHAALELSRWLIQARTSAPAARLVLSGRVLEQTANWGAISVPTLVEDQLSPAWALARIADELSRAGVAAVVRLPGANGQTSTPAERDVFLQMDRELIEHHPRGRRRGRPWAVLRNLDWLIAQHEEQTEIGEYLRELKQRLRDGPTVAFWIDELRAELRVLNSRAVRTRNSIVHGGPLITDVVRTVVATQDALASQALESVIEGLAAEIELAHLSAERRASWSNSLERLRSGAAPLDVLREAGA